jgi:hypothetical protein
MKFEFHCYSCSLGENLTSRPFHPPKAPACPKCGYQMDRVYGCQIDTSGCRDHDEIPAEHRIACGPGDHNLTPGQTAAMEARAQREIEQTRRDLADGGNKGGFRLTNRIPAALYHGKIRETKDPAYWNDPKNRARHRSTKVD